jgi:hypothetical protein
MMTAEHRDVRDVTPADVRRKQQARDMHNQKVRILKAKIERIERTITDLAKKPETSDELLSKWRQSWDWHNAELKKLEGK